MLGFACDGDNKLRDGDNTRVRTSRQHASRRVVMEGFVRESCPGVDWDKIFKPLEGVKAHAFYVDENNTLRPYYDMVYEDKSHEHPWVQGHIGVCTARVPQEAIELAGGNPLVLLGRKCVEKVYGFAGKIGGRDDQYFQEHGTIQRDNGRCHAILTQEEYGALAWANHYTCEVLIASGFCRVKDEAPFHLRYFKGMDVDIGAGEAGALDLASDTSCALVLARCCGKLGPHRDNCPKAVQKLEKERAELAEWAKRRAERAEQCAAEQAQAGAEEPEPDALLVVRGGINFCAGKGGSNVHRVDENMKAATSSSTENSVISKQGEWGVKMTVMDAVASGVPKDSKQVHSNEVVLDDAPVGPLFSESELRTFEILRTRLALLPMLFTALHCFFLQYHPECIKCLKQDAPTTPTVDNAIMKVDLDAAGAACIVARHAECMDIRTDVLAVHKGVGYCPRCKCRARLVQRAAGSSPDGKSAQVMNAGTWDRRAHYEQGEWVARSPFCGQCGGGCYIFCIA